MGTLRTDREGTSRRVVALARSPQFVYSSSMDRGCSNRTWQWVFALGFATMSSIIVSCNAPTPKTTPPRANVATTNPLGYVDQRIPDGFIPARPPPPLRHPPLSTPLMSALPNGIALVHSIYVHPTEGPPAPLPLIRAAVGFVGPSASNAPPRDHRIASGPGCGEVTIAGTVIPLDCLTDTYGEVPSAAHLVLPDAIYEPTPLYMGAAQMPQFVDHRAQGSEGPMRFQGPIAMAAALSFASAVDHALTIETGQPGFVSAMHVWSRAHTPSLALVGEMNQSHVLTSEEIWPLTNDNSKLACSWAAPFECRPACEPMGPCTCALPVEKCGRSVDPEWLNRANAHPVARVTAITRISTDKASLMKTLARGQDVWIAMHIQEKAFLQMGQKDEFPALIGDFDPGETSAGHALVVVGYRATARGAYFLLRNSWGEQWGEHGYAWIHESTLVKSLATAYVVGVEPIGHDAKTPRNEAFTQCASGLLPDSITAQCVPVCPDGSPRYNATCADKSGCPEGYANVLGECVVGAPNTKGIDVATGIGYTCSAGGCTYVVPRGFAGCTMTWCASSCPAPRFRLAANDAKLACVE